MSCQRCKSERVLNAGAKCSDMFSWSTKSKEGEGYVPHDIGIGGWDYVELSYCLDCGQIQGKFPLGHSSKVDEAPVVSTEEACEFCGTTKNVYYGIDPYTHDIDGDDTEHHICTKCSNERAADV